MTKTYQKTMLNDQKNQKPKTKNQKMKKKTKNQKHK